MTPEKPDRIQSRYDLEEASRYPGVMELTGAPPRDRPPSPLWKQQTSARDLMSHIQSSRSRASNLLERFILCPSGCTETILTTSRPCISSARMRGA